jgi:hypothetical protein
MVSKFGRVRISQGSNLTTPFALMCRDLSFQQREKLRQGWDSSDEHTRSLL